MMSTVSMVFSGMKYPKKAGGKTRRGCGGATVGKRKTIYKDGFSGL
jgi:hypothetical protein